MYKVFRFIVFICLLSVTLTAILYYFEIIKAELFAILSGSFGIAGTFFAIFANAPIKKESMEVAVDKVIDHYDEKTFKELHEARIEKKQLDDFIEHKSNERFLIKMRSYLEEEIIKKYESSEIAVLIKELVSIEIKLDELKVKYTAIDLPDRFKKILEDLDQEEKLNLYLDLLGAMPFLPMKKWTKAYIRLMYEIYKEKKN